MKRTTGIGLQWKLTFAVVLIVVFPLAVSYFLIDQLGSSAANVASNESALSVAAMEKSLDAYTASCSRPPSACTPRSRIASRNAPS